MAEVNYEAQFRSDFRAPLKPLDVVQPEGPSFVLDGHAINWDKWSLVVGFNAREAITLHDIRYDGRPVCHRASLVEMVVPYGTPANGHYRKNVFDIGEYGIRQAGKFAEAWLRLPRPHRLSRRPSEYDERRDHDDRERDLHPRRGQRHPLEALGFPHRTHAKSGARARS